MEYTDAIYGTTLLEEPVLLDLLHTRAVQRLDGVLQHGVTALIDLTAPTTRLEHSLGVLLLVRRLGGSEKEQAAALLHDVSHTAFSHVIDYVFHSHNSQGYHEVHKAAFVEHSDLPSTLTRHGLDWKDFLDEAAYPLLEQPAPRLCADRLDYFLRDSYSLGLASLDEIWAVLDRLVVHQGRIGVDDPDAARWLAYTYIAADNASWANFREVGLYECAARAIRLGLELGVIGEADLWDTDRRVWARLLAASQPELQAALRLVSLETLFIWDADHPTFRVSTKLRTLDPDVLAESSFQPLSSLDPDFARYRQAYLESKAGLWPVRVIPPKILASPSG